MLRTSVLSAILVTGCTDLVTVDVGAGRIEPVTIEERVALDDLASGRCLDAERDIEAADALEGTLSVRALPSSCRVEVELDDAVLVDRATMIAIADALADLDTTALVGIDVEVLELIVPGSTSVELGLERTTLARSTELPVRTSVPEAVVDAFLVAVEKRAELRADLTLAVAFPRGTALSRVDARMVLQPILRVDVVRAAL